MAFILHSSNRIENLVTHLSDVITKQALSNPLASETFLIQSQGMERWLSQQLSQLQPVWANYQFLFPHRFFNTLTQGIGGSLKSEHFDRDTMVWRIERLLRELNADHYPILAYYLCGTNVALKRYQLAQQLAQIFDQYQIMRPTMLSDWCQGILWYGTATEKWQCQLWLELTAQLGDVHRGTLWLNTIQQLEQANTGTFTAQLPERIFVFGMNTMPVLFLGYLQALARHCTIHLFLLNPSEDFWADISTKKQLIHDNNRFQGHPLLASLGEQGRHFQDLLLEHDIAFALETQNFHHHAKPSTLLEHLQNAILANKAILNEPCDYDHSITLHACHSRFREVEVAKNQILHCLEQDLQLALRDIIVMAPNIEQYEPFISAVFNDIEHAIADRSMRLTNSSLDAFIRFLTVCQGRFGYQSVLDLLEHPRVHPKFNLSVDDLSLIKHWTQQTQVRWGKSATHKQDLNLPAIEQNTWQAMLDRLLMGYAVGDEQFFVEGILPYRDIEGSQAYVLGNFCQFMTCLFEASEELTQAYSLQTWSQVLRKYSDRLLCDTEFVEQEQLHELIAQLSANLEEVHQYPVDLSVIVNCLQNRIEERKSSNGFLRGQLTFCSILPMRAIPFKVIVLLGINDGEFPRIDHQSQFDLIAQHFKKGDRSRRYDDRYQFLEILLSCRKQLIITYLGQSIRHNECTPPSIVVSELLDVLFEHYALKADELIRIEPLQAFSPRYFDGMHQHLINFSATDYEIAKHLTERKPSTPKLWWREVLTAVQPITSIMLADWLSFYRHPQRHFLRQQLGLYLQTITAPVEEREPFTVDTLSAYQIDQDCLAELLAGETLSVQTVQAKGSWIASSLGEIEFMRHESALKSFAQNIADMSLGARIDDVPIDITISYRNSQYQLIGQLSGCYENGSLLYRYANLKGKDVLLFLIHHHLINQVRPQTSYLLSKDYQLVISAQTTDQQGAYHELLWTLCNWYQRGLTQPSELFSDFCLIYMITRGSKKNDPDNALQKARDAYIKRIERGIEPEWQQLYRHLKVEQIIGDDFQQCCEYLLAVTHLQSLWASLSNKSKQ